MSRKRTLLLFVLGMAVPAVISLFQHSPGYMDADYYYSGGLRLAAGHGFSEDFLWNYLDDPQGLPQPSHTYWMPLTSVLSAVGIRLLPFLEPFEAAQVVFILLSALLAPLTAALSYTFFKDGKLAFITGLLAVFPGFYSAFFPTTDAFVLAALLGGLYFWRSLKLENWSQFMQLGLLAGLLHMARADGLLWLAIGIFAVWRKRDTVKLLPAGLAVIGGYLLVAGAWLGRNLTLFGALMPPGGSASMWLLSYDELCTYPPSLLTAQRWLQAGLTAALNARWDAFKLNLLTAIAVQGVIVLGPLTLTGAWRQRRRLPLQLGWLAWGITLAVMTVVFPFSGSRGGFFHSGAAFMPLVWALAPLGLKIGIEWMAQKRNWNPAAALPVFSSGLVLLALLVSAFTTVNQLRTWDNSTHQYQQVESYLQGLGASPGDVVMVNNPPTYFAATQRPAIVIPYGDFETVQLTAGRYHPHYLLLDANNTGKLSELYHTPQDFPGLDYLGVFQDFQVYAFSEAQ